MSLVPKAIAYHKVFRVSDPATKNVLLELYGLETSLYKLGSCEVHTNGIRYCVLLARLADAFMNHPNLTASEPLWWWHPFAGELPYSDCIWLPLMRHSMDMASLLLLELSREDDGGSISHGQRVRNQVYVRQMVGVLAFVSRNAREDYSKGPPAGSAPYTLTRLDVLTLILRAYGLYNYRMITLSDPRFQHHEEGTTIIMPTEDRKTCASLSRTALALLSRARDMEEPRGRTILYTRRGDKITVIPNNCRHDELDVVKAQQPYRPVVVTASSKKSKSTIIRLDDSKAEVPTAAATFQWVRNCQTSWLLDAMRVFADSDKRIGDAILMGRLAFHGGVKEDPAILNSLEDQNDRIAHTQVNSDVGHVHSICAEFTVLGPSQSLEHGTNPLEPDPRFWGGDTNFIRMQFDTL